MARNHIYFQQFYKITNIFICVSNNSTLIAQLVVNNNYTVRVYVYNISTLSDTCSIIWLVHMFPIIHNTAHMCPTIKNTCDSFVHESTYCLIGLHMLSCNALFTLTSSWTWLLRSRKMIPHDRCPYEKFDRTTRVITNRLTINSNWSGGHTRIRVCATATTTATTTTTTTTTAWRLLIYHWLYPMEWYWIDIQSKFRCLDSRKYSWGCLHKNKLVQSEVKWLNFVKWHFRFSDLALVMVLTTPCTSPVTSRNWEMVNNGPPTLKETAS